MTETAAMKANLANHEDRLIHIENQINDLQDRMPIGKTRRVLWLVFFILELAIPIAAGAWVIYGDDPRHPLIFLAFGMFVGRTVTRFVKTVSHGLRPG